MAEKMLIKSPLPLLLASMSVFFFGCTQTPIFSYRGPSSDLSSASATPMVSQQITATIVPGGEMENGILYYEYEYFQLEGLPPYPSPYVTMVSTSRYWIDMNDPNRFHHEGSFRTQEATPVEGMEFTRTGTGTNGVSEACEFYDGKANCVQNPITTTLTYDQWLNGFTHVGRRFVENKDNPEAIGGFQFKGVESDDTWGEVYVFERRGILTASDLYANLPLIETHKFDTHLYRQIETKHVVLDGNTPITHAYVRLIAWKVLDPSEVPPDLFSIKSR